MGHGSKPKSETTYSKPKQTFMLTRIPPASIERARALTEDLGGKADQYMNALIAQTEARKAKGDMQNWSIYGDSLPVEDRYSKMARGASADDPGRFAPLAGKVSEWADDAASQYASALQALNAPENQRPDLAKVDPKFWENLGNVPAPSSYKLPKGTAPGTTPPPVA
jgi:hypothetical protein